MKLAQTIVLQQQPTSVCCVATCIAMALGEPVAGLNVALGHAIGFDSFGPWLAQRGIWLERLPEGTPFLNGGLYIASARSLNNVGADHCVVLDTRGQKTNDSPQSAWKCYDPNDGREGKKIFTWMDDYHALKKYRLHDEVRDWVFQEQDDDALKAGQTQPKPSG